VLIIITGLWNSIYRVTRLDHDKEMIIKGRIKNNLYPTKLETGTGAKTPVGG
jgi:hypothetical protein